MIASMGQEGRIGSLFETPAEQPETESVYSVEAQARSDRSIRNQLRNLVLLQPVFQLDLNSARSGGDEFSFDELDAKALALIAFDFISYKMVMSLGARHDEIIVHLAEQAARMDPTLNSTGRERVAEHTLDALTNGRERHAAFRIPYYDLPMGRWREREFRLVEYEARADGELRYILTPEGITSFLSMLDIDPQVMQQVEELLIGKLIEKGSFEDALHLGRRARARTIEYQQRLNRMLRRYESYPGSVEPQEINAQIDRSLDHVTEREHEEGQLLAGLQNQDMSGLEREQRRLLSDVMELLNDCRRRHAELQSDLLDAPDRFLAAQSRLFRIRERSRIPSLEEEILKPLLDTLMRSLSAHGEAVSAALNVPKINTIFDPVTLTERIADVRDPQIEEDDRAIRNPNFESTEEVNRFPIETLQRMKAYLFEQISTRERIRFSELLDRAQADGYSALDRRCLAYLVIGAFCPDSSGYGIDSSTDGEFRNEWLAGVELSLSVRPPTDTQEGGAHEHD